MVLRTLLLLLGAAIFVACASPAVRTPGAEEIAACSARGGAYQQVGMASTWACVITYADGGRQCSEPSQCAGGCIFRSDASAAPREGALVAGACAPNNALYGCYAEVEGGRAKQTLCYD